MRISYKALKRFVDYPGTAKELVDLLADLGFPCDSTTEVGEGADQVLVGRIREKNPHPGADRLSLLKVDVGSETLSIVCGAQNMKSGDFVALAPIGATVPGKDGEGLKLKKTKIRGETSEGMCCSEAELRLSDESDGIWLLPFSEEQESEVLGKKISEVLDVQDWVIEVDITPNRGDAMSLRGLAREVAARLGLKMQTPFSVKFKNPSATVDPRIDNFEDAYGFAGCLVQGVQAKESPREIVRLLEACGSRSISNLVDITNVVLFELGHPIHFFDADKVDPASIEVRRAKEGEKLTLLDERLIELHPEDLVIADKSGPLSLAGVMGGIRSGVSESTKNILIEVASFNPRLIRASSKRHQISSESSQRFERGVQPYRLDEVMERALGLLKENSGYEMASGTKVVDRQMKPQSILWSREKVERKLGKLSQSDNEIFELLRRLEFEFEGAGDAAKVRFPWYRSDMDCLEDVMEDVARLIGYENLEMKPLQSTESVAVLKNLEKETSSLNRLLDRATERGFVEVLHLSFSDPKVEEKFQIDTSKAVKLQNPIHSEKSILRTSLIPSLVERAAYNASYGEDGVRLVEAGPVFSKEGDSDYENSPVVENWKVAVVWHYRPQDQKTMWHNPADAFYQFKGVVQDLWRGFKFVGKEDLNTSAYHPKRFLSDKRGIYGELHPGVLKDFGISGRVFAGEWSLEGQFKPVRYGRPWKYPSIDMDASFLVSRKIKAEEVLKSLESTKSPLLERVKVYDLFESKEIGKDKRSLTYALRYRHQDRTLELDEVKSEHDKLVSGVLSAFPADQIAMR